MKRLRRTSDCTAVEAVTGYVRANFDASAQVLDGTFQLVLRDVPYNAWQLNKFKSSAQNNLSFRDVKNVVKRNGVLLRSGGHGTLFWTVQQLAAWPTLLCAHMSEQEDDSSPSSAST